MDTSYKNEIWNKIGKQMKSVSYIFSIQKSIELNVSVTITMKQNTFLFI